MIAEMKPTKEIFGAVACAGARHIHPPTSSAVEMARTRFNAMVRDAQMDTSIDRVALFRYTSGKTELVDEWVRPGVTACDLHREDRRMFDLNQKLEVA